jgi:hypothetical protein
MIDGSRKPKLLTAGTSGVATRRTAPTPRRNHSPSGVGGLAREGVKNMSKNPVLKNAKKIAEWKGRKQSKSAGIVQASIIYTNARLSVTPQHLAINRATMTQSDREARFTEPRFLALKADPDFKQYQVDNESVVLKFLRGGKPKSAALRLAARRRELYARHGIGPDENEFEPSTWKRAGSLGEMEKRLTFLIDLNDSVREIMDLPAANEHATLDKAKEAYCMAKAVHEMVGVDKELLAGIDPHREITRGEQRTIYIKLRGLVLEARKTRESTPAADGVEHLTSPMQKKAIAAALGITVKKLNDLRSTYRIKKHSKKTYQLDLSNHSQEIRNRFKATT